MKPATNTAITLDGKTSLRDFLVAEANLISTMNRHAVGKYFSLAEFALAQGRSFAPDRHVKKYFGSGIPQQCYYNCYQLAGRSAGRLIYCEGYMLFMIPVFHAWCITRDGGKLVEPTLPSPAAEYFGVPIRMPFLRQCRARAKRFGVFDCPELEWPLLSRPAAEWRQQI